MKTSTLQIIAVLALIAAAAPHVFFEPSLILHMRAEMDAWIGLAVWAPAILASVAFFFGVEFGAQKEVDSAPSARAMKLLAAVVVGLVVCGLATTQTWTGISVAPPDFSFALVMFAGLAALRALFFQGFLQHQLLKEIPPLSRAATIVAAELVVVLPFILHDNPATSAVLLFAAVEGAVAALSYELGYTVRSTLATRALFGAAFVWCQQAYLL